MIEEPNHRWIDESQSVKDNLMKLGNLHIKRLVYMKHVHIIYQSMISWTLYFCRGLNYSPHYQMATNDIFSKYNKKSTGFITQTFCSNSYIKVSHRYDVSNISDEFLDSLIKKIFNAKKSNQNNGPRQNYFIDFGFTTSMCTSRSNDSNGISKPLLKPGSNDPLIVKCFSILSSIAKCESCSWISNSPIYSDDRFPDRFNDFSFKICRGNIVEAIRIALVDSNNICHIHEDKHNDPYHSMSTVISIGKIVTMNNGNIWRLSIIGYSRKSISDYYIRKRKYVPIIREFVLYHNKVLSDLKTSETMDTFDTNVKKGTISYNNPFENLNLPVNISLSMIKEFNLNYVQSISVISAYILSYKDSLLFNEACKRLHIHKTKNAIGKKIDIGYLILKTITKLKKRSIKYGRKVNKSYSFIQKKEFKTLSSLLCCQFLYIFQEKHLHSSKKNRTTLFRKIFAEVHNIYQKYKQYDPQCPIFQVAAIIGLVPYWIIYECIIDCGSEGFRFLMDTNNMKPNSVTCTHLIESIRHILTRASGHKISTQYIIGVIHNYGKQLKTNKKYETFKCSPTRVWKYTISIEICGVVVIDSSNHISKILKSPFIHKWQISNSMKTIYDILNEMNIIIPDNIGVASLRKRSILKMMSIFGYVVKDEMAIV